MFDPQRWQCSILETLETLLNTINCSPLRLISNAWNERCYNVMIEIKDFYVNVSVSFKSCTTVFILSVTDISLVNDIDRQQKLTSCFVVWISSKPKNANLIVRVILAEQLPFVISAFIPWPRGSVVKRANSQSQRFDSHLGKVLRSPIFLKRVVPSNTPKPLPFPTSH